jgi:hypothetical protein
MCDGGKAQTFVRAFGKTSSRPRGSFPLFVYV